MTIFYTGIGCNQTGEHSESEFLAIMNKEFTHKSWKHELSANPSDFYYLFQFKDWVLPDDFAFFTLLDWIEYSGAEIRA